MTTTTLVAEPIRAWKVARVGVVNGHLPRQYLPRIVPLSARRAVRLDEVARCHVGITPGTIDHTHEQTPHEGCRCGYYAKPDRLRPALGASVTQAALRVELSGRVIEHDDPSTLAGSVYRAQRQRLVAIELPGSCECGGSAVALRGRPAGSHVLDRSYDPADLLILDTVCAVCDGGPAPRWTRVDLAELYGVDVAWTDDWTPVGASYVLGAAVAAGAAAANAFSQAMVRVTQTLSLSFADVAASLQRMHDALDWPPPLDACRQDSETVLEWKARHDDLRRRGLPRPPRRTGRAGRR